MFNVVFVCMFLLSKWFLFFFYLGNTNLRYPFFYRHLKPLEEDGWDLFSLEMEFSHLCSLTQQWRISHANSNYEVHFEYIIATDWVFSYQHYHFHHHHCHHHHHPNRHCSVDSIDRHHHANHHYHCSIDYCSATIVTPEYVTEVQLCVPWRCDFLHYICRSYTIRKTWLKFSKTHTGSARKSFWYYNYNLHYPWMSFKPNNAWC